ncbi:exodeoxyribonuclease VII large subunit [Selenomonas sp. oral taxon 478]|uniref:exodeoxyribonuclease VII large subunit n=1 Tax=Selenomonas sp. oral taxon 478 TaxID=712538 RepID=UPI00067A3704|nr:exodeoxyribonuclease VII large subunit [Selenomonas sp. oral taxon 478]AKT52972.1 hypothetical protein ADJ74_00095 [Selenomonas sp. oral taxon 478]
MKIILNVPYEEKDLVKALHGRWDGKSWYIPEGVDYHPFRKWIDPKTYQSLEAPLNIDDLLLQYKKTVSPALGSFQTIVVIGDVCRVFSGENNKQVFTYLDLTNSPNAKPCISIRIDQKMDVPLDIRVKVTGILSVHNGNLQIRASEILPIDEPTVFKRTLAQWENDYPPITNLQKKKVEIRFNRIGVIAPKESAGYNDFIDILGDKFEIIKSFDSLTAESMIRRIQVMDQEELDCICLIRGGGSIYGFLDFNHPKLIQTIYEARHPIAIGVGHSTDDLACNDYADLVAITPTALADALLSIKGNSTNKTEKNRNKTRSAGRSSYEELLEENAHLRSELNHLKDLYELEQKKKKGFFSRLFS